MMIELRQLTADRPDNAFLKELGSRLRNLRIESALAKSAFDLCGLYRRDNQGIEARRTLERRHVDVVPRSLQIGLSVRQARRSILRAALGSVRIAREQTAGNQEQPDCGRIVGPAATGRKKSTAGRKCVHGHAL
jgi:hypothetical protein